MAHRLGCSGRDWGGNSRRRETRVGWDKWRWEGGRRDGGRRDGGRGAGEGRVAGNAPYGLNGCYFDGGEEVLGVGEVDMIDESGNGDGIKVVW